MDQKNHSQNNVYFQDYKHTSPDERRADVKALNHNPDNSVIIISIIAVLGMLAAGGYYIFQNSTSVSELLSKHTQDNSNNDTIASTQVDTTDQESDFEPLDLDLIEGIDLVAEDLVEESRSAPHITEPQVSELKTGDTVKQPDVAEENWVTVKIQKGDSLSKIFDRLNLSHKDAIAVASSENMKSLNYLTVGQELEIEIDAEHKFTGLKYQVNQLKSLVVSKDTDGKFVTETHEVEPTVRIRDVTAPIQGNLFSTAEKLNISNRVIGKLSTIFRWDIDFARDIQNGDRFSVIFEEKYVGDEMMATGEILAAEFVINGNITRAIRHEDKDGNTHYYTPEGKSLKKAFMRNPLKFVNITSGFTHRRYHPVLKKWRAHKGVDYGAPRGTPIMTTADGVIEHIGRKNAYGKTIVINHGQGYSTLYAHMNSYNKGLKKGSRVKQGQIIGFVGRTGLATGNHLHYEFRVNGKHVNPLAVDLPRSLPIDSEELNKFIAQSEKWVRRLDALQGQSVASITSQTLIPPSI